MAEPQFTGTYEHRIDERGRLAIPAPFRGGFGYGGVLLLGPDHQLELYTADGFERMVDERQRGAGHDRDARRLRRAIHARSERVQLDRQGRITIPAPMRERRGIEGLTFVAGLGGYIEIWSEDAWAEESSEVDEVFAELLEGLARIAAVEDDEAQS